MARPVACRVCAPSTSVYRCTLPFFGSYGFQPPCVRPRMSRMMSTGSTPRMRATTCSRYDGKKWSCGAGGARGADLRRLLAEARRPQGELTLALQVRRLTVEGPDHDHVAVERLERRLGERVDDRAGTARRRPWARTCRRPRERGREGAGLVEPMRRSRSPLYAIPRAGWPSGRVRTTDAAIPRTFSTDSGSPTEIRMPSPAKGRTTRPASAKLLGDRERLGAGGQPDEVALRVRHCPAEGAQRRDELVAACRR